MPLKAMWAMYFGGLVAIRYHPKNEGKPNLEECAQIADEMTLLTIKRFGDDNGRMGSSSASGNATSGQLDAIKLRT